MKVVFLSMLFEREYEKQYALKSKVPLQNHANTFQWDLIEGLDILLGSNLTLINQMPFASYPKYNQLVFKTEKLRIRKNEDDMNIGFLNIQGIKQITRERNYKKSIAKFLKENTEEKIYFLVYSLYLPTLNVVKWLESYNNVETAIIVPDLPSIYGVLPENKIKKIVYNTYGKKMLDLVMYADKFVLFADAMKIPLKIENKPYVVVEGVVSKDDNFEGTIISDRNQTNERIVLYTGSLSYTFGIKNLLDAFSTIDNMDLNLWICGGGEAEKEITQLEKRDKRVKYFGYVTKEEIYSLQDKADILINPRGVEGEYNKFSFPSKTFEYLKSGKPIIMCKLPSMPQEYYEHLYLLENNSVDEITAKITEICSKPKAELMAKGKNARDWVMQNKNSLKQAEKIINLLENNFNVI